MARGLLDVSGWVRPFGFVKNEYETESELDPGQGELDLLTVAILVVIDVLTLPLAVLWLAGVGREG
jgi:hypothetical protein